MSFDFDSMPRKYEALTGKKWDIRGQADLALLKRKCYVVSLELNYEVMESMHIVRDWCQDHFGDNWIYNWNDFYFSRSEDATLFMLRWS